MMVLKDPTDWFRDLQLILDVVTSSTFRCRSMTGGDPLSPPISVACAESSGSTSHIHKHTCGSHHGCPLPPEQLSGDVLRNDTMAFPRVSPRRCQHGHRRSVVMCFERFAAARSQRVRRGGGSRRRRRRMCRCTSATRTCCGPTSSRCRGWGRAPSQRAWRPCTRRCGVEGAAHGLQNLWPFPRVYSVGDTKRHKSVAHAAGCCDPCAANGASPTVFMLESSIAGWGRRVWAFMVLS